MRAELPEYVVNCLIASGFDSYKALATLDLSDKPGNSLEKIKVYISKKYPDDDRFKCDAFSDMAEFPLGHINLIKEFVKEANRVPFKRRCTSSIPPSKKRAAATSTVDANHQEQLPILELDKISANIRQQIAAWQRQQKDERLRNMKEHDDFGVHVELTKDGTNCNTSVECKKCHTKHTLGMSIKNKAIISNWSRHITKCINKQTTHSASTMHSYFTPRLVSQFQLALYADQKSDENDQHFRLSPPNSGEGEY